LEWRRRCRAAAAATEGDGGGSRIRFRAAASAGWRGTGGAAARVRWRDCTGVEVKQRVVAAARGGGTAVESSGVRVQAVEREE